MVRRSSTVDKATQDIIYPVIQRNAYFAHPECILLAMLTDKNPSWRKLAQARILKARSNPKNSVRRVYSIPEINFEADSYVDMINWNIGYNEPPVLVNIDKDEITKMVETGEVPENIRSLPCHNQKVERTIKLVSETSKKAMDKDEKEGIVHSVLVSRSELPRFESKQEFVKKLKLRMK